METEEARQKIKVLSTKAMSRLEGIEKLESSPQPPKTSSKQGKRNLLSELDSLPPPPSEMPKGGGGTRSTGKAATMPRGMYYKVHSG